ncbi:hypothetical protein DM860_014133 [Cuscuta australis]|uniref:Pentatricopeptide repeat-containing protein n=1 Tax=Cuscuta australis TaxID=267555 RepID=A0A328DEX2_9ASTE|nr:hypothetical protein DM860_014133 [Cuscuta australis]
MNSVSSEIHPPGQIKYKNNARGLCSGTGVIQPNESRKGGAISLQPCRVFTRGFVFKTMTKEHRLVPSDEHFGCVVDLLSRGRMLEEAFHLLNCVLLRENSFALGTFIAYCLANGNAKMGEQVGRRLLSIEPGSASAYDLVSNLYAGQAKWQGRRG